ncbi:GPI ethanolamine phosphate transferase 2, catalytic subunit-like [Mytilus galloprovincialis]|uniref:GPI ethanolamine phosphate transferase 2, catalytic subunit-like n=1 Tax=Mytilus galloprovincialis TaxID=29158 RepID=UPI003F7C89AB
MKIFILTINIFSTLLAYSVFLRSFISPKKTLDDTSSHENVFQKLHSNDVHPISNVYRKMFSEMIYEKVVVVLIDALRVDFAGGEQMPFLQSKKELDGMNSFVAIVKPPTVTLPRIKALTTGSIPGFVDVVMNFGSSSLTEDNVVTQMKHHGKKMVFYGDDTWLNLFPDHFVRYEGTTSFFVTDYTEVDNNVTRYLEKELSELDFDMMVLHYLGLDHIGHIAGPFSPLIGPKLKEMDDIIRNIYQELSKNDVPSLVIVCGDHGMSDQGGHGGATESEIKVPVIFLRTGEISSQKKKKDIPVHEIEQIDLAPTLSLLLGTPIPKNNIGTVVTDVFAGFDIQQKLVALMVNGLQVSEVLQHNVADYELDKGYQLYTRTHKSFVTWINSNMSTAVSLEQGFNLRKQFEDSIKLMSTKVSSSITQYDGYGLVVSIVLLWLILFTLVSMDRNNRQEWLSWQVFLIVLLIGTFSHMTVCTSDWIHSDLLCDSTVLSRGLQLSMLGIFAVMMTCLICSFVGGSVLVILFSTFKNICRRGTISILLQTGTVIHTLSLLSSSFVEEEHQTWYFFIITIHILIIKNMCEQIFQLKHNKTLNISQKENSLYETEPVKYGLKSDSLKEYQLPNTDNVVERDFKEIHLLHSKVYHNKNSCSNEKQVCTLREEPIPSIRNIAMVIVVLFLYRLMRSWNQTGNKWLNIPDIGDWLIRPENVYLLSVLVAVSILVVFLCKLMWMSILQQFIYSIGLLCVYLHKSANGSLVQILSPSDKNGCLEAQIVYTSLLLYILVSVWNKFQHDKAKYYKISSEVHTAFILLLLVLSRPHNIILVAMMVVQDLLIELHIWPNLKFSISDWTLYFLWMSQGTFFYQGNSNSISTVDVSAGYIGLHDYQPIIVGCLLTLSSYGGIIFWMLSLLKLIYWKSHQDKDKDNKSTIRRVKNSLLECVHVVCLFRALPLSVYTVLVTFMRYHLFVWTVFSPKLLYEGMLTVVLSVISFILLLCNIIL